MANLFVVTEDSEPAILWLSRVTLSVRISEKVVRFLNVHTRMGMLEAPEYSQKHVSYLHISLCEYFIGIETVHERWKKTSIFASL